MGRTPRAAKKKIRDDSDESDAVIPKKEECTMKSANLFRTAHSAVTADFPASTAGIIRKHENEIDKIHAYVFNPENVDVPSLIRIAEKARIASENGRRRMVIVHVFDKKDRATMKRALRGVPKGKWFHLNLVKGLGTVYSLAPDHFIIVRNGRIEECVDDPRAWPKKRTIAVTEYPRIAEQESERPADSNERAEKAGTELLKDIASKLDGLDYCDFSRPSRPAEIMFSEAKRKGVVIAYGMSDDLIEFDGAYREEAGVFLSGESSRETITFDSAGTSDDGNRHANELTVSGQQFDADGFPRAFSVDMPHETFRMYDDGSKYCRGIVFLKSDMKD